jgi:Mg-chelatase subunit ChlD
MLEDHKISRLNTHVSVIEYSDEATVLIYLNDTFDGKELNTRIDRVVSSKGRNAMVHKALEEANNVFSINNGGRPGAAKAVVILTDGDSSSLSDLEAASKSLRDSGTRVYVVRIGDTKDQDEVTKIVSVPEDVFPVVDPSVLPNVGPRVTQKIKTDVEKGE